MGKSHKPRAGSLMFWPRKKAKRGYARLRHQSTKIKSKEPKPAGFAGYKAGMTHVIVIDNRAKSLTKGTSISFPVTVIECPSLKVASIRFYKKDNHGMHVDSEIIHSKLDKELARKVNLPKKAETEKRLNEIGAKAEDFNDIRIVVYTQPKLTGIGKKKPDVFEIAIGGSIKEKFGWAKEHLGKEFTAEQIFAEGQQVDVHAISKGKGFQGPVKRFGISLKSHKSEKTRRGVGNLGAWTPKHVGFEVPHAGQMGYHQRTDYNKLILKISNKAEEINPKDGFVRYGVVKNPYILLKGSVPGPAKRLVSLTNATRPDKLVPKEAPEIENISLESKQGK